MERNPDAFVFDSYTVLTNKKEINFNYKYRNEVYTEKILLPKEIPDSLNKELVKIVLKNLHLILGISYFKMFCPKKIVIPYYLTKDQAEFWNTVYTKGLGEFFYKNKIDFRQLINFPYKDTAKDDPVNERRREQILIGIGGGKDSIVAVELLKKQEKQLTGFILENQSIRSTVQMEVTKMMNIDYLIVKRILDSKLLKNQQALNGHIPITAIYSFVALLLATIYDFSTIVIPNGKSANFGNVNYLGSEINHQWSKSEEFEKLFQRYLKQNITSNISYYSNLRQYSEMEIAKMFSGYKKYFPVFSSCNRNFTIMGDVQRRRWCGKCAKCAFAFIILAANLSKAETISIFDENLLDDSELIPTYLDLIGKGKMKPFDCVGTFEESIQAFKKIKKKGEFIDLPVMKNIGQLV